MYLMEFYDPRFSDIYINFFFLQLRIKSYVKRPMGFVPFVIDITVDCSEFLIKRSSVILKRLFGLVEKYSNMHAKCPIKVSICLSIVIFLLPNHLFT